MTQPSISDRPRGALDAFRDVCDKFTELSRTPVDGVIPVWSDAGTQMKYLFRHPVKTYQCLQREGVRMRSAVVSLAPFFPLEVMMEFLSKYSESQLMAIKSLSEINVRRVKSMVTDNLVFKLGVPVGSVYGLFQVSNKLVIAHGSSLDFYRQILTSPLMQEVMGYVLASFIFLFVMFGVSYLLTTGPMILRAQLLDDILLVALEEKRFAKTVTSGLTWDDQSPAEVPHESGP